MQECRQQPQRSSCLLQDVPIGGGTCACLGVGSWDQGVLLLYHAPRPLFPPPKTGARLQGKVEHGRGDGRVVLAMRRLERYMQLLPIPLGACRPVLERRGCRREVSFSNETKR